MRSDTKWLVVVFVILFFLLVLLSGGLLADKLPCRGVFGKPDYTGKDLVNGDPEIGTNEYKAIQVRACYLGKGERGNEILIGFFENYFKVRKLKVSLGGKLSTIGVCELKGGQEECTSQTGNWALDKLERGQVYGFFIVSYDSKYISVNETDYENYKKEAGIFKKAVLTGNYRDVNEKAVFVVSQLSTN